MNDETIDLRELIEIVWKGKIIIIISIIIAMLISIVLSFFVLDKKFESKATVQITSNTAAEGIVKEYIDSEFTSQVFSERIKSQIFIEQVFEEKGQKVSNQNLNVSIDPATSMISLTYTSGDAKESGDVLTTLINEQKIAIANALQKEFTLLADSYTEESKKLSNEIRDLIKLYNTTVHTNNLPEILILQSMVSNQLILDLSKEQQASLVNVDGEIQNDLIQLQARIESKSTEYSKILDQYQTVQTNIESFRADPLIKTIIEPTIASDPSSPNTLLNIAIGLVVGAMIGLVIVFIRKYWLETSPKNE
ncbi:Wzz/FepE/Etk N-terminal domain-containing protein [Psychrobacillus psychrodurans]|uniref:Wzz/FepE/Etk N-terminal domain-containing protein n=1 Tax=Psychrobacillus psychrodurans TaxID=126157 RepID=A0A9X3R8R4_9BACI|nr:Wzz/FepE/Etk N-terminal domain-containing protein [Psychrobacillus psychrodurans]MCZ8532021.1 Wzz/FepE/Etk N-terminal domain-containing protein [Psychrobacillus psychrodurans]